MLPLPELDNQNFDQIVEEARKMIPQLFPGWTDENYHDPGITFIELLSWLTEMQHFFLNRITNRNELKFLKLMGIKLQDTSPAGTDVTFGNVQQEMMLPAATRLAAGDQVFETVEPLYLLSAQIDKILVKYRDNYRDFTLFNNTRGLTYYVFGREANKHNQLLIGLDHDLPPEVELSMVLHMYEDYPVKPGWGGYDDEIIPPARVTWKYYGRQGGNKGWLPLQILNDASLCFTRSGIIKFIVPAAMETARFTPALDRDRFWIACFLEDDIYALPPRMEGICFNTVAVLQQSTLSEVHEFSSSGESGMQFKLASSLALNGYNEVQVRDGNGDWVFWQETADVSCAEAGEKVFGLTRQNQGQEMILSFGNGEQGMVPPEGKDNIRVISFNPRFEEQRWLGKSNGLPAQSFALPVYSLLGKHLRLQVGKRSKTSGEMLWQDWQAVEDFAASGPGDRHYMLDEEQDIILFGNHVNGMNPEREEETNILIIGCKTGGGARGNVKEHEINRILEDDPVLELLQVVNHRPAYGGASKETIDEAMQRLRIERNNPCRAVTAADFEALALNTPGLRVARVKAVPLYKPGMKNYPHKAAEGQVTVAVMPYSESLTPVPSPGFKETVRRHLNRHRLLSTEVHVVSPEYIRISVYAAVVVAPGTIQGGDRITRELDRFLQPLDRDNWSGGWPFGRTVYRGDIYEVINRIPGVEYVKELWISAEGSSLRRELSGDFAIPPCGLVYPGDHEIEIINRNEL